MAKLNPKHKKVQQMLDKLKSSTTNKKLLIRNRILDLIRFILNIDIGWLFVFATTYLFNFTYPWEWRLIGSVGLYYSFKIFIKEVKGLVGIMNKGDKR